MVARCMKAFGSQRIDVGVVERGHRDWAHDPLEECISETRVASECRPVEVGANNGAGHHTFRTIAVAFADFY
jgi:hypothetical protein